MLTLKITQLWNVSFLSDSVKSTVDQIQYSMNISGVVWFEVYQCGTPYCAINNKKKRTRKRQTKNHSTLDRPVKSFVKIYGKMYTYLIELCIYIYVYVFIIVNAKWITDHGVWFPCMIYTHHTWRLYFLILREEFKYSILSFFFGQSSRFYKNKKKKLNLLIYFISPIYIESFTLNSFFSLYFLLIVLSSSILIFRKNRSHQLSSRRRYYFGQWTYLVLFFMYR